MVSKIEFNFYYSKDKPIIKVNITDYDNLKMSSFLLKALKEYNTQNPNEQIVEETQYYKIRLAKKNGKPDSDLPSISHDLIVRESNWFNFSIQLENDHYLYGNPEENQNKVLSSASDSSHQRELKAKQTNTQEKMTVKKQNKNSEVEIQENQGGICCCLVACFKKKKN